MSEPIRRRVRVRCGVADAFLAFTGRIDLWWPPGHRKLHGSRLTMEGRAGGRLFERGSEGQEADLGEVLLWDPPRRLAYTWLPGVASGATRVDVAFDGDGDGTIVTIVHSEGGAGLGDAWPERAERFACAWRHVLPAFEQFVAERAVAEEAASKGTAR